MNEIEEYNPEIHCCETWYKDFCECVKKGMRKYRKEKRDKNVEKTKKILNKNNIPFACSKTPNVVVLNCNNEKIYLSLKRVNNKLFKCKYENNPKWYTYKKDNFLKLFI